MPMTQIGGAVSPAQAAAGATSVVAHTAAGALVGADGRALAVNVASWTSQRPYLCSLGDSINSQDVPASLEGAANGVSPAFWGNALCAGAFDWLGPYETSLAAASGTQTIPQTLRNGMWGSSGALIQQAVKFVVDGYLTDIKSRVGSRPFAVLLSGGINDLANTDTSGFDASLWADYQVILQKVIDAGGFPIAKVLEPSTNFNTRNKRRNRSAFAERVMAFAAGRNDMAVANIEQAWRSYGRGVTLERATRGVTGDGVHPNMTGSTIHGFAVRDAMKGRVIFSPPWERNGFAGSIIGSISEFAGAAGTKGVNAAGAASVPTGWTLNSFGGNTSVWSSTSEVDGSIPGVRIIGTAAAGVVTDSLGLATTTAPSVTASGPVYRAWVDLDVLRADYVNGISFRVRTTGSTFVGIGSVGSSDMRAMTDATAATPFCPSAAKLLEGSRVVLAGMPFQFPASPTGTLHDVGGTSSSMTNALARLETHVRFAGLIQEA